MHHIDTPKIFQLATIEQMLATKMPVGAAIFVAEMPTLLYVKRIDNSPVSIRDFVIHTTDDISTLSVIDENEQFKRKVHDAQKQHEREMAAAQARQRIGVANSAADAIHLFATKGIEVRNRESFANRKYVAGVDPYGNPEHGSSEWFRDKVKEAQEVAEDQKRRSFAGFINEHLWGILTVNTLIIVAFYLFCLLEKNQQHGNSIHKRRARRRIARSSHHP